MFFGAPHTHTVSPGSSDALITHSICSAPTHTHTLHHHLSYGIHRVHTCVHTIPAQRVIRRGARRPLKRPHSEAETNISVHHNEANTGTLLTRTNQQSGVVHAWNDDISLKFPFGAKKGWNLLYRSADFTGSKVVITNISLPVTSIIYFKWSQHGSVVPFCVVSHVHPVFLFLQYIYRKPPTGFCWTTAGLLFNLKSVIRSRAAMTHWQQVGRKLVGGFLDMVFWEITNDL